MGLCFWNAFSQLMETGCGWYIKHFVWTDKYQMNQKTSDKIFLGRDVQWETFWKNHQMTNCYKKSIRNQSEFQDQWKENYEVPRYLNKSLKIQSSSELSAGT